MVAAAAVLASREPAARPRASSGDIALKAETSLDVRPPRAPVATTRAVEPAVANPPTSGSPAITITGCLERGARSYLLKNASGANVSPSRNWKSGFLKKRSPQFELVDTTNSLELPALVGKRVAATGVLVDRELQARSLRPLSGSCS
jgi:hypothetical protein